MVVEWLRNFIKFNLLLSILILLLTFIYASNEVLFFYWLLFCRFCFLGCMHFPIFSCVRCDFLFSYYRNLILKFALYCKFPLSYYNNLALQFSLYCGFPFSYYNNLTLQFSLYCRCAIFHSKCNSILLCIANVSYYSIFSKLLCMGEMSQL